MIIGKVNGNSLKKNVLHMERGQVYVIFIRLELSFVDCVYSVFFGNLCGIFRVDLVIALTL